MIIATFSVVLFICLFVCLPEVKAYDVLHPVKAVSKVWYLATDFFCPVGARGLCNCVTAFRVSALRGEVVQASNAMHHNIHVCLLIPLFSILVVGCLESDDRSCWRLRHSSLVNSSIK